MDSIAPRAKINDVARLAGVSTKTVSRVLNNEPNVRDATRSRVKEAAEALNYTPDFSARSLAGQKSYLIAMFYDTASQGYLGQFQAGALAQCGEYGYHLIVERCDLVSPKLGKRVADIAGRLRVDGVMLIPPLSGHEQVLAGLEQIGIPYVQVVPGDASTAKRYLDLDDVRAAYELTTYLIELGHKRIAHIKGHPDHGASSQRYRGYRAALSTAGLELDESLIVQGMFSIASGKAGAAVLLRNDNRPTAIFAANDDMAAGALTCARELGLQLPDDLSIVGFDDAEIASVTYPPLTTVRQPIEDMANGAVDLLIEAIRSKGRFVEEAKVPARHYGFEIIKRDSASAPAKA